MTTTSPDPLQTPIVKQKRTWRVSQLRGTFVAAVGIQLGVFTVSLMTLGGAALLIFIPSMIGHWLWVGWLMANRRHALTRVDTVMITAGFFLWIVVSFLLLGGLLLIDRTLNG